MKEDRVNPSGEAKVEGVITPPIKLRDGNSPIFSPRDMFGFMPEQFLVMKVPGRNNWYQLMGLFTPEEKEKRSRLTDAKKEEELAKVNKKQDD